MSGPDFLDVPRRTAKPRAAGLTEVLDRGMPPACCADLLDTSGPHIDLWKFGWGVSYLDPHVTAKVEMLARRQVLACPGGTLLEIAWAQGRAGAFLDWAGGCGFPCVEVSAGTVAMGPDEKRALISAAARRFTVLAEAGAKDPAARQTAEQWAQEVRRDLDAGASWVLAEGRASGAAGVYDQSGMVRGEIVDAVAGAGGVESVIFEAPRERQQAWFVRRFGPNVNLANVAPEDALGLETLRLSLRADTYVARRADAVRAHGA